MRNIPNDNVSLLTPDLLTSLFNMNTFTDVVDTLPITNPSVRQGTLSMANPSVRQGIVSLFGQGPLQTQTQTQTLFQESVQQQQQQQQEELSKEQQEELSKEQQQFNEEVDTFTEDFDKRQDTVKLDLNIDIDKIGRSDKIGDNYDKYII
jgi:uncharacterized FlaG/YvyC family protein